MPSSILYDIERDDTLRCLACGYFHTGTTAICDACTHRGVSVPPMWHEESTLDDHPSPCETFALLDEPSNHPIDNNLCALDPVTKTFENASPSTLPCEMPSAPVSPSCRVCRHTAVAEINDLLHTDTDSFTHMAKTFHLPRQVFSLHRTHCLGLPKHTKMSASLKGRTIARTHAPAVLLSSHVPSFRDAMRAECLRLSTAMTDATTEIETLQALIDSAQARFRQYAAQLQALQTYAQLVDQDTNHVSQHKDA